MRFRSACPPAGLPLLIPCLTLLVLAAGGCSSDQAGFGLVESRWPTVHGLILRDENAEVIGTYGQPEDGGLLAFPNPADVFRVDFTVPAERSVRIWISRALGPGEEAPRWNAGFGNTYVPVSESSFVVTLYDDILPAGYHAIVWNGRDAQDRVQPTGYYRIQAAIGQEVLFADVWHVDSDDFRFPPGLEDLLYRPW